MDGFIMYDLNMVAMYLGVAILLLALVVSR
jgi:hypothetical protein